VHRAHGAHGDAGAGSEVIVWLEPAASAALSSTRRLISYLVRSRAPSYDFESLAERRRLAQRDLGAPINVAGKKPANISAIARIWRPTEAPVDGTDGTLLYRTASRQLS
jgi:hypothetical protein